MKILSKEAMRSVATHLDFVPSEEEVAAFLGSRPWLAMKQTLASTMSQASDVLTSAKATIEDIRYAQGLWDACAGVLDHPERMVNEYGAPKNMDVVETKLREIFRKEEQ